nr:MAG TPA: hypothetical protein [Caudoviricetes sp.]
MLLRELPDWVEEYRDMINETAIGGWKIKEGTKCEQAVDVLRNVKKLSGELQGAVTSITIPYFDVAFPFDEWDALYSLGMAMRADQNEMGEFMCKLIALDFLDPALQLLKELSAFEICDAFLHGNEYQRRLIDEVRELKDFVDEF